jgi:hypothetical protein
METGWTPGSVDPVDEGVGMPEQAVARKVPIALYRIARDPERTNDLHQLLREFGHQMRNRLNSLKLGLYLGRRIDENSGGRAGDWEHVERQYLALERLFEQYQAVWQPMRIMPIQLCLGLFLREKSQVWRSRFRPQGVEVDLLMPQAPPIARFDASQLGSALDRFARWRAEALTEGATIRIVLEAHAAEARLRWEEPAPAASLGESETSNWVALPILARVVAGHGGSIDLDTEPGFRVHMRWPIDVRPVEGTAPAVSCAAIASFTCRRPAAPP